MVAVGAASVVYAGDDRTRRRPTPSRRRPASAPAGTALSAIGNNRSRHRSMPTRTRPRDPPSPTPTAAPLGAACASLTGGRNPRRPKSGLQRPCRPPSPTTEAAPPARPQLPARTTAGLGAARYRVGGHLATHRAPAPRPAPQRQHHPRRVLHVLHVLHLRRQVPAQSETRSPEATPQKTTPLDNTATIPRRGLRFLRARWTVLVRLGCWSVLETGQTFLVGYGLARALDAGFLVGRGGVGLGWLGVAGVGVVVGAFGTGRVYRGVADLVEPLRDLLVQRVVARGVREANGGALSGLTQQVELARDTFAGLVMVSRSFLFTAVGALAGLFSLDPLLLLVVAPPLVAGVCLFTATLRPLARRQETFLLADEALADRLGTVCPGLRDITAAGAEERVATDTGHLVDAELRAARSLARWGVLRVTSLAIGGQLPIVLLLATAPWLLDHGVTPGGLVGALAYVTQSLLPALQNLVHGLGTSGSRLAVVLRRLAPPSASGPRSTVPHLSAPPGEPLLRDADPALPQGTHLTVVDPSGTPTTVTHLASQQAGEPVHLPFPQGAHPAPPPAGEPVPDNPSPPALSLASVTFAYGTAGAPVLRDLTLALPKAPTWPS